MGPPRPPAKSKGAAVAASSHAARYSEEKMYWQMDDETTTSPEPLIAAGASCLVLGSAPNPRLPARDTAGMTLVCINGSAWSARRLGLKTPDLTVMCHFRLFAEDMGPHRTAMHGLATRKLLIVPHANAQTFEAIRQVLAVLEFCYDRIVNFDKKREIIKAVTGLDHGTGDPDTTKLSNGLFAACLAIHQGASEVILSGISLDSDGHNYLKLVRRRKHVVPDRTAIEVMLSRNLPVKTAEVGLAAIGLELV